MTTENTGTTRRSTTYTSTVSLRRLEHVELGGFGGMQLDGDGSSVQTPVLIAARSSHIGVPQEYALLQGRFGQMGQDWTVAVRSLGLNEHGRTVESFCLDLRDGKKVDFHFDVTSFYRS